MATIFQSGGGVLPCAIVTQENTADRSSDVRALIIIVEGAPAVAAALDRPSRSICERGRAAGTAAAIKPRRRRGRRTVTTATATATATVSVPMGP